MSKYVVRGEERGGGSPMFVWATAADDGSYTDSFRGRARVFGSASDALPAWAELLTMFDNVRIFAVADDGTETPLPTYEEALAEIARLRAEVARVPGLEQANQEAHQAIANLKAKIARINEARFTRESKPLRNVAGDTERRAK